MKAFDTLFRLFVYSGLSKQRYMVVIVTLQGSVGKEAVVGGEGGGTMKGRVWGGGGERQASE